MSRESRNLVILNGLAVRENCDQVPAMTTIGANVAAAWPLALVVIGSSRGRWLWLEKRPGRRPTRSDEPRVCRVPRQPNLEDAVRPAPQLHQAAAQEADEAIAECAQRLVACRSR